MIGSCRPLNNHFPVYASTPYAVNGRCLKDEIVSNNIITLHHTVMYNAIQSDHFPSYNDSLENSDANYYGNIKEEDSVDRLLGSLSPIPGEAHDLSMDHFSIVTSQAVCKPISNRFHVFQFFLFSYSGHSFIKKRNQP